MRTRTLQLLADVVTACSVKPNFTLGVHWFVVFMFDANQMILRLYSQFPEQVVVPSCVGRGTLVHLLRIGITERGHLKRPSLSRCTVPTLPAIYFLFFPSNFTVSLQQHLERTLGQKNTTSPAQDTQTQPTTHEQRTQTQAQTQRAHTQRHTQRHTHTQDRETETPHHTTQRHAREQREGAKKHKPHLGHNANFAASAHCVRPLRSAAIRACLCGLESSFVRVFFVCASSACAFFASLSLCGCVCE